MSGFSPSPASGRRWRVAPDEGRKFLQAFRQAIPNPALFLSSKSKDCFGGFECFQGFASVSGRNAGFPNFLREKGVEVGSAPIGLAAKRVSLSQFRKIRNRNHVPITTVCLRPGRANGPPYGRDASCRPLALNDGLENFASALSVLAEHSPGRRRDSQANHGRRRLKAHSEALDDGTNGLYRSALSWPGLSRPSTSRRLEKRARFDAISPCARSHRDDLQQY